MTVATSGWRLQWYSLSSGERPGDPRRGDPLVDRATDRPDDPPDRQIPTRQVVRQRRVLARGQRNVPLLVEDGRVVQVGWQGRSCIVDLE